MCENLQSRFFICRGWRNEKELITSWCQSVRAERMIFLVLNYLLFPLRTTDTSRTYDNTVQHAPKRNSHRLPKMKTDVCLPPSAQNGPIVLWRLRLKSDSLQSRRGRQPGFIHDINYRALTRNGFWCQKITDNPAQIQCWTNRKIETLFFTERTLLQTNRRKANGTSRRSNPRAENPKLSKLYYRHRALKTTHAEENMYMEKEE